MLCYSPYLIASKVVVLVSWSQNHSLFVSFTILPMITPRSFPGHRRCSECITIGTERCIHQYFKSCCLPYGQNRCYIRKSRRIPENIDHHLAIVMTSATFTIDARPRYVAGPRSRNLTHSLMCFVVFLPSATWLLQSAISWPCLTHHLIVIPWAILLTFNLPACLTVLIPFQLP